MITTGWVARAIISMTPVVLIGILIVYVVCNF